MVDRAAGRGRRVAVARRSRPVPLRPSDVRRDDPRRDSGLRRAPGAGRAERAVDGRRGGSSSSGPAPARRRRVLLQRHPAATLVGIDESPAMLAALRTGCCRRLERAAGRGAAAGPVAGRSVRPGRERARGPPSRRRREGRPVPAYPSRRSLPVADSCSPTSSCRPTRPTLSPTSPPATTSRAPSPSSSAGWRGRVRAVDVVWSTTTWRDRCVARCARSDEQRQPRW